MPIPASPLLMDAVGDYLIVDELGQYGEDYGEAAAAREREQEHAWIARAAVDAVVAAVLDRAAAAAVSALNDEVLSTDNT